MICFQTGGTRRPRILRSFSFLMWWTLIRSCDPQTSQVFARRRATSSVLVFTQCRWSGPSWMGANLSVLSDTSPNTATYSGPPLARGLVAFRTRLTTPSRVRCGAVYFRLMAVAVVLRIAASVLSNDQYIAQCRWLNQPRFAARL